MSRTTVPREIERSPWGLDNGLIPIMKSDLHPRRGAGSFTGRCAYRPSYRERGSNSTLICRHFPRPWLEGKVFSTVHEPYLRKIYTSFS